MGKLEEYLERAKDLAEDAGEAAKNFAEDVRDRAKELSDERGKVRELTQGAREQAAALSLGAREKVQGVMQDAKAAKEIRQGINELEALPEFEGSIIYKMDLEAMINDLGKLLLFIGDNRLDDPSVAEEIRKVMGKVQPAQTVDADTAVGGPAPDELVTGRILTEEQAVDRAKSIAYSACGRALAALNAAAE